ncbi:MAG: hypothetical protein K6G65_07825 [Lachnospiraceae bacterium]|nr:hypothetical protein [Lachnospiraceae bacterium]
MLEWITTYETRVDILFSFIQFLMGVMLILPSKERETRRKLNLVTLYYCGVFVLYITSKGLWMGVGGTVFATVIGAWVLYKKLSAVFAEFVVYFTTVFVGLDFAIKFITIDTSSFAYLLDADGNIAIPILTVMTMVALVVAVEIGLFRRNLHKNRNVNRIILGNYFLLAAFFAGRTSEVFYNEPSEVEDYFYPAINVLYERSTYYIPLLELAIVVVLLVMEKRSGVISRLIQKCSKRWFVEVVSLLIAAMPYGILYKLMCSGGPTMFTERMYGFAIDVFGSWMSISFAVMLLCCVGVYLVVRHSFARWLKNGC